MKYKKPFIILFSIFLIGCVIIHYNFDIFAKPRTSRSSSRSKSSSKSRSSSKPKTSTKSSSSKSNSSSSSKPKTSIKSSSNSSTSSSSSKPKTSINNTTNGNSNTSSSSPKPKYRTTNNIPRTYIDNSISNNYYYQRTDWASDFLGNYWLYRALTPSRRIYIVDGVTHYAPAYTGVTSILFDIITFIIIVGIIVAIILFVVHKRKKNYMN